MLLDRLNKNRTLILIYSVFGCQAVRLRRERAQSLIEFAVIFPILVLMLAGIVEIGFLYYTSYTLENASREGARFAVALEDLVENDTRVLDRVDNLLSASSFFSEFIGSTTNNGITDCNVSDQVTVNVSGTYNFVALRLLGLTNISLSFPTSMRYELCE
jgi:Flp pilus assembly protein TadG